MYTTRHTSKLLLLNFLYKYSKISLKIFVTRGKKGKKLDYYFVIPNSFIEFITGPF